jgi:hypothetical protein
MRAAALELIYHVSGDHVRRFAESMTLDSLKSEKKKGFAISTTEIAKNRWDGSSSTTVDAQLHHLWQLFFVVPG